MQLKIQYKNIKVAGRFLNFQLDNKKQSCKVTTRASKNFVLLVLCTKAEIGYFGGRQAVKGEESQYSLTEALCLFWVPPWGLHVSPVANIPIIDRVLYCRMAFLSPTHNWKLTLKMIQGIRKILFKLILYFFRYFPLILRICFATCMNCMKVFMWKSWLCQEWKGGRFCFEKSKEAENNFLMLWLPQTCSVKHLKMCRARKVVNFAKPCVPIWLTLSISSWQGNGKWLEFNWDHVFLERPQTLVAASSRGSFSFDQSVSMKFAVSASTPALVVAVAPEPVVTFNLKADWKLAGSYWAPDGFQMWDKNLHFFTHGECAMKSHTTSFIHSLAWLVHCWLRWWNSKDRVCSQAGLNGHRNCKW